MLKSNNQHVCNQGILESNVTTNQIQDVTEMHFT